MNSKEYSRREFLRTFAALSTTPLLVTMLSGCGESDPSGVALYGPGPVAAYGPYPPGITVSSMVFLDAQSNQVALSGNQSVPVHTSFILQFSTPMDVASVVAAIAFIDSNNNPVGFALSPGQTDQYSILVTIAPAADLLPNANYTLSVKDTAMDSSGNKLIVNTNASAAFKTAA